MWSYHFEKYYLSYFYLCYLYLLRLGLGSYECRVGSCNENSGHWVCGEIQNIGCVSVTDWCYSSMYILIPQFESKLLIFNKTYSLERQIPHSVSRPLRSQDSIFNSIQSNTERSQGGWRWVYLKFSSSSIPSHFPVVFFILPSSFTSSLFLRQNYI